MKRYSVLILFVLACALSHAQTGAFLIPRVVYVGDPAALILPLPELKAQTADIILTPQSPDFPSAANIDFHRIVLERRVSGSRLLIEFTAFVPGVTELPVIEAGGERFTGLSVTIGSVINSAQSGLELSVPASPLAIPGTSLMIYGTMTVLVLLLLLTLWFLLRGRRYLHGWITKWKRWKLFVSMKIMEKHLYRALLKGGKTRDILDTLSDELRTFLSFLSGANCRAMTARELERLSLEPTPVLGKFFCRCDELRFSGGAVSTEDVFPLLADLRVFLDALEKAEKEKSEPKEMAA